MKYIFRKETNEISVFVYANKETSSDDIIMEELGCQAGYKNWTGIEFGNDKLERLTDAMQYECCIVNMPETGSSVWWHVLPPYSNKLPVIFKLLLPDVYKFVLKQHAWMIIVKIQKIVSRQRGRRTSGGITPEIIAEAQDALACHVCEKNEEVTA